jgi:hypothetical protein
MDAVRCVACAVAPIALLGERHWPPRDRRHPQAADHRLSPGAMVSRSFDRPVRIVSTDDLMPHCGQQENRGRSRIALFGGRLPKTPNSGICCGAATRCPSVTGRALASGIASLKSLVGEFFLLAVIARGCWAAAWLRASRPSHDSHQPIFPPWQHQTGHPESAQTIAAARCSGLKTVGYGKMLAREQGRGERRDRLWFN